MASGAQSPAAGASSLAAEVEAGTVPVQQIAVDPEFHNDDGDSSLGDEVTLSTASINSTILEYRKLHGRTFHNFKQAEYWGPNDDQQNDGLDMNHHMLYMALDNKLHLAPLKEPLKILDIGTGTGIWAMDMADEYPSAEVLGVDLSPTQPRWVPPNCRFELDDVTEDWTFADNTFDFIHIRFMLGCFKDWSKIYRECLRCLKPGGWIEHQDVSLRVGCDDGSIPQGSIWEEWATVFAEAGTRMGRPTELINGGVWTTAIEAAGFQALEKRHVKVPLGTWALDRKWKEIGQLNRITFENSLEGYALYMLTQVMGWDYVRTQLWLTEVRDALKNRSYHGYTIWASAWAQKPE